MVAAVLSRNAKASSKKECLDGAIPEVKVLVCAQSNAAVDELVVRLADSNLHFTTDGDGRCGTDYDATAVSIWKLCKCEKYPCQRHFFSPRRVLEW